jgi:4'-phosphopantetheinyl transferase
VSDARLHPVMRPQLEADDPTIHVWQFSLAVLDSSLLALRALLNVEECARADRFYRPIHQQRFAAGRGILRLLLSPYIGIPADEIQFVYGPNGKPALDRHSDLAFNLSHTADEAIVAIARGTDLGVDIEVFGDDREFEKLARRYFAHEEHAQLMALPAHDQQAAFYQCWTAKEALVKAWGLGLTAPLHEFVVTVMPGYTALERMAVPVWAHLDWRLTALPAPANHAAALAYSGDPRPVEYGVVQVRGSGIRTIRSVYL